MIKPAMVFVAMDGKKPKIVKKKIGVRRKSVEEKSYIRNGRLRVKHQNHSCRWKSSVYQTVSWKVIGLSLRDVKGKSDCLL